MNKIKTQTLVSIALYGGLSSMLLWPLSIIPIITIVAGVMALMRFTKEEDQTDKGYAILGLTLGIIFLIVRLLS